MLLLHDLQDRRLSTLKYDSLTRVERSCYRSSKKLRFHLRNIFRCKALQTVATEGSQTCMNGVSTVLAEGAGAFSFLHGMGKQPKNSMSLITQH